MYNYVMFITRLHQLATALQLLTSRVNRNILTYMWSSGVMFSNTLFSELFNGIKTFKPACCLNIIVIISTTYSLCFEAVQSVTGREYSTFSVEEG